MKKLFKGLGAGAVLLLAACGGGSDTPPSPFLLEPLPTASVSLFAGTLLNIDNDASGAAAGFLHPASVATDSHGNIFLADYDNHSIREITPGGAATTFAGLSRVAGAVDGTGSAARFNHPFALAIDSSDNVYVADTDNNMIRKITPVGVVTTLAGSTEGGYVDAIGAAARFRMPEGIAVDSAGVVYVSDTQNCLIRKIATNGTVSTIAGSELASFYYDAVGTAARFNFPMGLVVSGGVIYVADSNNHAIRAIASDGTVTTLAGIGTHAGYGDNPFGGGSQFWMPTSVALDPVSGDLLVADAGNHRIRRVRTADGVTTTFAGGGSSTPEDGSTASIPQAAFGLPVGVTVTTGGTVYVADYLASSLRKIINTSATTPVTSTLAGTNRNEPGGVNDGPGVTATFHSPQGMSSDSSGNLYTVENEAHVVRKITPAGVVSTVAGSNFTPGFYDNTVSYVVLFNHPTSVASAPDGTLYVTDSWNNAIRKVTPSGATTTFAGGAQGSADGAGNTSQFLQPTGIARDHNGTLYIADTGNSTIRKITAAGNVTTLAGSAGLTGAGNGNGAAARFNHPTAVAVNAAGTVFVADTGNYLIRRISASGDVTTLAGLAGTSGATDGTGSTARFGEMGYSMLADDAGNVLVPDINGLRLVRASGEVITPVSSSIDTLFGFQGLVRSIGGVAVANGKLYFSTGRFQAILSAQ
ncbi:MAG: hypothetical protein PSX71_11935 [bacterium]|nr:hypothetical protein [bacterium]